MKSKRIMTGFFCMVLAVFTCQAQAQAKKKTPLKKTPAATVPKPVPLPFATASEIEDGKALIAKSDCLACHKTEDKLVGPAYIAIASKYPQDQNTVNLLTQKIVNGGNGVWGTVPMAPHPAIKPEDASKMIKYILTLNTKNPPVNSK